MSKEPPLKSWIALSRERIRLKHSNTQTLLHASFMCGKHKAFKEHVENNPVHNTFDGSLAHGINLVMSKERNLSDVAPTLTILLQNGAKLAHDHLIMADRNTPYHVISRSAGDHQELLELMITEVGQSLLNVKDNNGCTALMYAVSNANPNCVKCLIANGADLNLINHQHTVGNNGPLIDSIKLLNPKSRHSYNIMMGIFDLLLDSGADVNTPCHLQNRTPIMYAAAMGDINCVGKLIQKGAQVNCTDNDGDTVWTLAARAGSVDLLKCLIEDHGVDQNSTGADRLSMLYWAIGSGSIEAVRYLLKQGVTMTSFVPQERVEACRKCGENVECHYLDANQLHTDPYVLAIRSNKPDVLRLMDEYGCELSKSPEILSHAIRVNSVDVVDYLLCNYKYPLNCGYKEKYTTSRWSYDHQTFLNKSCEMQSVQMVKLLLDHGADPNKKYCVEKFPGVINVAICYQHVNITGYFIRRGVNMNIRSYYRNIFGTPGLDDIGGGGIVLPFEAAVYDNHICEAEMLLVAGCSRGVYSWNNNRAPKSNIGHEMQELLKEWNVHKNDVLPLKQRCRMVILNHLCPQADKKIIELPLPTQLIKYLSIPELDDILETYR